MKNKGFTLIELLAVITILSVLVLITGISVTKLISDSKTKLSNTQIANIKSAAESWGIDNIRDLPDAGECSYITLKDLKEYGLLNDNVIDPKTREEISDELKIKITTTSGKTGVPIIEYEVNPNSVSGCNDATVICELVSGTPKTYGAAYNCTVKKDTTYKFYVLNNPTGDTVDLIMSANITRDGIAITDSTLATDDVFVEWLSVNDYIDVGGQNVFFNEFINENGYVSDYNTDITSYGPITAMNYLYHATKDWNYVTNMVLDYTTSGYSLLTTKNDTAVLSTATKINEELNLGNGVTAIYRNLKARLPYYEELSNLNFESGNEFLYDNLQWGAGKSGIYCSTDEESSSELFKKIDNSYNCVNSSFVKGYWLLTLGDNNNVGDSFRTIGAPYRLQSYGQYVDSKTDTYIFTELFPDFYFGIRPVITLPISELG